MKKLGVFVVLLSLLLAFGCKKKTSEKVESEMATAQKIKKLEMDINARQDQMNELLRQYVSEGGSDVGEVVGQNLTPEQKAVLEKKLRSEEGIGYRDLISEILDKQEAIEELKVSVQDLEKKLPNGILVNRGDTHMQLAENFLVKEKGLDPEEAKKLIEQNYLMDEMVPGFKVWHFYDDGVYGTFVTQGSASVSPYRHVRRKKQKLIKEKNEAVSQRDMLKEQKATLLEQVAELESRRDRLNQDVSLLQAEREDLLKSLQETRELSEEYQSKLNSVFYALGERKTLIERGVIKDPVMGRARLASYDAESYPKRLDLREGDTISFTAEQAGVEEITRIKLAPTHSFKNGKDFELTLSEDGKQATVRLLNPDKFRTERTMAIVVN